MTAACSRMTASGVPAQREEAVPQLGRLDIPEPELQLPERRHIGKHRRALCARDGKQLDPRVLIEGHHRRGGVEHGLDLGAKQPDRCRARAAIGHMLEIDAVDLPNIAPGSATACRHGAVVHLARIGPGIGDELLDAVDRDILVDRKGELEGAHAGDWRQILQRIESRAA